MKKISDNVYDNLETNRRERWYDNAIASSLPRDKKMDENKFFPWGSFPDLPRKGEVNDKER